MSEPWIETVSGRRFYPFSPRVEDIIPDDIAHALSLLCRFNGHTRTFYSVAQHSVIVSHAVPQEDAPWGLLHDAAEAYIGDLAHPVKHHGRLAGFRETEADLMRAIVVRFGLVRNRPISVKVADARIIVNERRDLMSVSGNVWISDGLVPLPIDTIVPQSPLTAERLFLERFGELWGKTAAS